MAKGLGSGMPISAIGARAELMAHWKPGTHGGTYGGGNAAAAAAASPPSTRSAENSLVENAATQGARLQARVCASSRPNTHHRRRARAGLMVGVEFTQPGSAARAELAARVQACLARDLLLLTCGTYGNVIRWIPPLVVNGAQIDAALTVFNEAMAETSE
jgi:4-aminobutyrate aminotransferase